MSNNSLSSIQEKVLEKIREGRVHRRSRAYFVSRVLATVLVSVVLLALSVLVVSYIAFSLHESGEQFLLGFGWHGVQVFLQLFPWIPFLVSIALVFVLQWLLRGFKFAYRVPILNIFLVICAVTIALGIGVSVTPLHPALQNAADNDQLPVLGNFYAHLHDSHENHGFCHGTVSTVAPHSFTLKNDDHDRDYDDGTFTIFVSPGTNLAIPPVGSHVIVFGTPENDMIEAQHIAPFAPDQDHR